MANYHAVYIDSPYSWTYNTDSYDSKLGFYSNAWLTNETEETSETPVISCSYFYEIGKQDEVGFTPRRISMNESSGILTVEGKQENVSSLVSKSFRLNSPSPRFLNLRESMRKRRPARFIVNNIITDDDAELNNIKDYLGLNEEEAEAISRSEEFGAEGVNFELIPSVEIEGVGIVSEGSPYLKNNYDVKWDEYNIYDDDAAEVIFSIPANDSRMPLQEGELELITAMVYGFNHPLADASWGELNERGMFWAAKTMEELANYEPYEAEEFGAEAYEGFEQGNHHIEDKYFYELTEREDEYWSGGQNKLNPVWGNESFINALITENQNEENYSPKFIVDFLLETLKQKEKELNIIQRRYKDENIKTFLQRNPFTSRRVMNPDFEDSNDNMTGMTPSEGWGSAWINIAIKSLNQEIDDVYERDMNRYGDMPDGAWDYVGELQEIRKQLKRDRNLVFGVPYDSESFGAEEDENAERIMKLLKIVKRKATGSNARYAKTYAREAENAYYQYGMRGLTTQVAYVLSNLSGWRGEEAKSVKAELRKLIK